MIRLLYIGKSNKKFTHGRFYNWNGTATGDYANSNNLEMNITVRTNNSLVHFNQNHNDYFDNHFKFLNETEYAKYIRKKKLKMISKVGD